MAAKFSLPGRPIHVFDSESTPGNEDGIDCAIREGEKLITPQSPSSGFIRYMLEFPGSRDEILDKVRFEFPNSPPPRKPPRR